MTESRSRRLMDIKRQLTFEDLKGTRAEGYVRDSTPDQRDGFGPDIQRRNLERFADSYGLVMGTRWYTEFVSGRKVEKRLEFKEFLQDAKLDLYDVLLVDHTSRFGRNQEECIRFKGEMQRLGKLIVFVSQGIISGRDQDFLSERINETLDEAYSRNLSRWIESGLLMKHEEGLANGMPPLGYMSQKTLSGKREKKIINPATMPTLLELLRCYSSGEFSYDSLAAHLNAEGYRNREGKLFSSGSIEHVLANRFYEGKVVYHPGGIDEEVRDGTHEVPPEVKELWLRCQEVKKERAKTAAGHPRRPTRTYSFSQILACSQCGSPYHGEALLKPGGEVLRLFHMRRGEGRLCPVRPLSQTAQAVSRQFGERVLSHLNLDANWKSQIVASLRQQTGANDDEAKAQRLRRVLENLRKQHIWGDLTDDAYLKERQGVERQLKSLSNSTVRIQVPNLDRAAELLGDLPQLWEHPGVSESQRERLIREVFNRILINGVDLMAIEPKQAYAPLFAMIATSSGVGYRRFESSHPDQFPHDCASNMVARTNGSGAICHEVGPV